MSGKQKRIWRRKGHRGMNIPTLSINVSILWIRGKSTHEEKWSPGSQNYKCLDVSSLWIQLHYMTRRCGGWKIVCRLRIFKSRRLVVNRLCVDRTDCELRSCKSVTNGCWDATLAKRKQGIALLETTRIRSRQNRRMKLRAKCIPAILPMGSQYVPNKEKGLTRVSIPQGDSNATQGFVLPILEILWAFQRKASTGLMKVAQNSKQIQAQTLSMPRQSSAL